MLSRDLSTIETSVPRARQLRDEPQSGRYPTRGYQQRQPSLERGAADRMDLNNLEPGTCGLKTHSCTMRRESSVSLTEDSHINVSFCCSRSYKRRPRSGRYHSRLSAASIVIPRRS